MGPVLDFGSEELKARIMPRVAQGAICSLAITEPNAGSDATGMTTRFSPDGDEIVIDGGKIFITSGDVADLILLFGKWSEIDDDRGAITALVLEKGGARIRGREDRGQDGHPRLVHGGALVRRLPRAPREPGRRAGGGAFHPSPVAQQVASPASRATRSASPMRRSRTWSPS